MQRLASCAIRVKLVSTIVFNRTQGHEVLGILHYPSQMSEFDCTPGHEALGILRYSSETGEFDCLRLHPRPCSA